MKILAPYFFVALFFLVDEPTRCPLTSPTLLAQAEPTC
jgi:hypothetical protein